ncbi:hypothetical protein INT46_008287 [Mucor plumbeus]|uniref:Uncharacterized protein n=1 Tax=Mucor plumbeus TaxID=97098 RepID=A0A8H7RSL5_9FUNG|nr:hypothetical protein INT46_008287 [Mucor plumbeus]
MDNTYKLTNEKNDPSLKFFSENPISDWSFAKYETSFNKDKARSVNAAKIKNTYKSLLERIKELSDVPDFVKAEVHRLSLALESPKAMSENISFNIIAHDSSVINALGSGTFNSNQQLQPTEIVQQQKKDIDPTLELEHSRDEESEEEDKILSDLSIHHHPYRTCEYTLAFTDEEKEEEGEGDETDFENTSDESEWMLDGVSISDLCFDLKNTTLKLTKYTDPAQLSDIRLLALKDIYIFDRDFTSSVSKYAHRAQVLTQILPVLINGPPNDSNEDSFVHYYLSPLLSSVFASDPLLKMKWANGQLIKNNNAAFKPEFLVYNISGSVKCVILIAEFKPTEQNSYVESDLVKLSKQMKDTLNKLVIKGVTKPRICGIHCEGENVHTYVMDLPSPKLYRIINASKIKLFKNVDQMSLLPNVITHLLCLKGVASETATKVETASLYSYSKLKRPAPNPPVSWLSSENVTLSRIPKKQKK